jgi:hypothetical protein
MEIWMTRFAPMAAVGVLALILAACASQPHAMLAGSHPMAPKAGVMADRAMPGRSPDCSEEALKSMPPEHRQQCPAAPKAK